MGSTGMMRVVLVRDNAKKYSKEQLLLAVSLIRKNPGKRGGGFRKAMETLGASDSGLSRYILKCGKLTAVGEQRVYRKSRSKI